MNTPLAASVIVPAHNEAAYLGDCLNAVLASDLGHAQIEILVVANGCTDSTARIARDIGVRAPVPLHVIETPQGGKLHALRLGDEAALYGTRIYLDADVVVSHGLIAELISVLAVEVPRYASGVPRIARARDVVTRAYARFWQTLPFVQQNAPGFGAFAVNGAGRARWGNWPDIISDDTFVRLQFTPKERVRVEHTYCWPMVEGFANLVRVRRRQDRGVAEIAERYPQLLTNDDKDGLGVGGIVRRAFRDPIGFMAYIGVALATKLPGRGGWVRGR
ncbi:glycosyltransferase [Roseovarius pelagicus]|uniref:Glycosyltransferase n=1 Tax=Roseovarius pelagicus TaxID=2980108 RepID=A0ABY6DBJ3_9RHOB|nr:glycosyltransferase [Roseovarius pelagicus]UXX83519.1 glycosyltransferase [Roseovarius pelagicus]